MRINVGTVIGFVGFAAIATGMWLIAPALGLIVSGAIAMYVAYQMGG
ncbi:hypothetical protein LGT39_12465 [Demequina sp. TTPB684]|nr:MULTISPECIES: hypothetical protein [unclassified Demequina]MCB2413658.1 hypothetical protein [Demequina sp. TTPB684]UPU87721.1 hypothetical protein LGT36_010720 [Demequina sp. TMPB413]